MPEDKKRVLEEMKRRLTNGETISVPSQIICEKCNYHLPIHSDRHRETFICCPNCDYPMWCFGYRRVPDFLGRLPWYCIKNKNGEAISDYKGDVRLFESPKAAKEYMLCCKLDSTKYSILFYGELK